MGPPGGGAGPATAVRGHRALDGPAVPGRRGRVEVLLSGEGADELFGGFPWFHHPRRAQAPDFPWTPTTDELVGTLFAPAIKELEVLAFRADHYRDALAEIPG